jgi:transferase CAF17, mitochondrial
LGQELIAKAHFTGVIRKRIMPFTFLNESMSAQFSGENEILNLKLNKSIGKVKRVKGEFGIGLVRMANIDNENIVIVDDNKEQHRIKLRIPEYWQMNEALENELKSAKF